MPQFGDIFIYKHLIETMCVDDDIGPIISFSDVTLLKTLVNKYENKTIESEKKYEGCTFHCDDVILHFYSNNEDFYFSLKTE